MFIINDGQFVDESLPFKRDYFRHCNVMEVKKNGDINTGAPSENNKSFNLGLF